MISIPLPFVLTLCATGFGALIITRPWLPRAAKWYFGGMAGLLALLTILVALRFAYGMEEVLAVQRLLPFWVGPLIYLGFSAISEATKRLKTQSLVHFTFALMMAVSVSTVPSITAYVDGLIGGSYLVYAALLYQFWQDGPDRLSRVGIAHVPALRRLILLAICLLVLSTAFDTVIALDFIFNSGNNVGWLLSLTGVIMLLLLGVGVWWSRRPGTTAKPATDENVKNADAQLIAQATVLLEATRLYTDPQLSLTRLARRLGVTDRMLSEAVNRHTARNVSQFINGFRVTEAARLLRETDDSVRAVGEAAGFLTRSNFYAEFQRIHGQSPGAYRKTGARAEGP